MKAFAISAGRKAAATAVAGTVATASQPSAHARELVQQAPERVGQHSGIPRRSVLDEEWLVTDLSDEVLVFKPYSTTEVDEAIAQVTGMLPCAPSSSKARTGGVVIEDLDGCHTPASNASGTTLGADADSVLGQSLASLDLDSQTIDLDAHSATSSATNTVLTGPTANGPNEQMTDLLRITSKLLKRPGLQKEVFKCMLEDEEVRGLMLKQSRNIDAYLTAVGIHNPNLLPAPENAPSFATTGLYRAVAAAQEGQEGVEGEEGRGLLQVILDAVAACIDKTGSALAGLGGWMRSKVTSLAAQLNALFADDDTDESQAQGKAKDGSNSQGETETDGSKRAGDVLLGAVMVVVVAVTCVLLARRPVLLAASAAAVAMTHQVVSNNITDVTPPAGDSAAASAADDASSYATISSAPPSPRAPW